MTASEHPVADAEACFRELDGFDHIHLDCSTNTFSRAMRHHGLDPRVLGEDWGYWFLPTPDRSPLLCLHVIRRAQEETILDWYGYGTRTTDHPDPATTWLHIEEVLAKGNVAIIDVDLYAWPLSSFHGKLHYPHRVVVAARRGDEALVLDGRGSRRSAGWMNLADLNRAMGQEELGTMDFGVHIAGINRTTELLPPDPARPLHRPDQTERFRSQLARNVNRYLGIHDHRAEPSGYQQLNTFIADMRRHLAQYDGSDLPDDLVMPTLGALGAPSTQWRLASLFLSQADGHLTVDLTPAVRGFEEIATAWSKVFHMFFLGYHARRRRATLLENALERITELAALEARTVGELAHTLGQDTPRQPTV